MIGGGMVEWLPQLGAVPDDDGVTFRVWATRPTRVELLVEEPDGRQHTVPMEREGAYWRARLEGARPGLRYGYLLEGSGPYPDPCARRQPGGPEGLSQVVDPRQFRWTCGEWTPPPAHELVIAEIHVGTWTPEGTFDAAAARLPELATTGFTAVELMPVATFEGNRGWGYDTVLPFAPFEPYGGPDGLRRFVDAAHTVGLAVILDVVFNHLAPSARFLEAFAPEWFRRDVETPWGPALNFDGPGCEHVRRHVVECLLHWACEYRIDGFRLDAAHAIADTSPRHIIAELRAALERALPERRPYLIAETPENDVRYLKPTVEGGLGCDAVWADDFRHAVTSLFDEARQGRTAGFTGSATEVARTIVQGWLFEGQRDPGFGALRGTVARRQPPYQFVYALEHHDHVANLQLGDRLPTLLGRGALRAATALTLLLPQTPLLFQGQEFAANSPFFYFADPPPERRTAVRQGRHRELAGLRGTEAGLGALPDPDDPRAFASSKLDWGQATVGYGSLHREFVRRLLRLRREDPVLTAARHATAPLDAWAEGEVVVVHVKAGGSERLIAANFGHRRRIELPPGRAWKVTFHSNDPATGGNGAAPIVDPDTLRAMLPARCTAFLVPA
jgi:maltooligosyltrehalose trehalohydrolase